MCGYEDVEQKKYTFIEVMILACIVTFFVILIFVGSMLLIDRHVTRNMFAKVIDYVESQINSESTENDTLPQTTNVIVENIAVLRELNNSTFNNNILNFIYILGTSILGVTSGIILYKSSEQREEIEKDAKRVESLLKESNKDKKRIKLLLNESMEDKEKISELYAYIKTYLEINSNLELCKSYIGLYRSNDNTNEKYINVSNISEYVSMVGHIVNRIDNKGQSHIPLSGNQCAILQSEISIINRMLDDCIKKEMNEEIQKSLKVAKSCLEVVEESIRRWQSATQTNF